MTQRTAQTRLAPGSKTAPTPAMLDALEALADGALTCFRVGYAHSFKGPFHARGTIEGLWKRNLCDIADKRYAKTRIAISPEGRAALAAARPMGAAA